MRRFIFSILGSFTLSRYRVDKRDGPEHGDLYELEQDFFFDVVDTKMNRVVKYSRRIFFHFAASLFFAISVGSAFAQTGAQVIDNDNLTAQWRLLSDFDSVTVDGALDVAGTLGETSEIVLHGDPNVLETIKAAVSNRTLAIRIDSPKVTANPPKIFFMTKELREFRIGGSSRVVLTGLDSVTFKVEVNGVGEIRCAGKVGGLEIVVNGSGKVDAADYSAEKALVAVNGSGRVTVKVKEALRAEINGSGSVEYGGNPSLSQSLKGSGRIGRIR